MKKFIADELHIVLKQLEDKQKEILKNSPTVFTAREVLENIDEINRVRVFINSSPHN